MPVNAKVQQIFTHDKAETNSSTDASSGAAIYFMGIGASSIITGLLILFAIPSIRANRSKVAGQLSEKTAWETEKAKLIALGDKSYQQQNSASKNTYDIAAKDHKKIIDPKAKKHSELRKEVEDLEAISSTHSRQVINAKEQKTNDLANARAKFDIYFNSESGKAQAKLDACRAENDIVDAYNEHIILETVVQNLKAQIK